MPPDHAALQVTADRLRKNAYLYVRQSTLKQVLTNTESALRQYDLKSRAVALGWDAGQVIVIDIDQGHSGASIADRQGFQKLVAEVGMGKAGIVLGLECSRLARNNADWHRLLEICALAGTLICDEDGLYDPNDFNDRLLLGMKGQISEAELHFLRSRMRGGTLSKARRGELAIALPAGLAYDAAGAVCLDPDQAVQQAVAHLFATFAATGSAHAVVKAFHAAGLTFPRGTVTARPKGNWTGRRCSITPSCGCCTAPGTPVPTATAGAAASAAPTAHSPLPPCPAPNGPPSSPARTPATSPWRSSTPTRRAWPPPPRPTEATAKPARPAKDPPSARASSSAAAAATG